MKISKEHKAILIKAVSIAKLNGFEIDDAFFTDVNVEDDLFDGMKRYYNVIFDHEFARCFWTDDLYIDIVPEEADDELPEDADLVATLKTGNHPIAAIILARKNMRIPMWQYNLAQMVLSEDPLMYMKDTLEEAGI